MVSGKPEHLNEAALSRGPAWFGFTVHVTSNASNALLF